MTPMNHRKAVAANGISDRATSTRSRRADVVSSWDESPGLLGSARSTTTSEVVSSTAKTMPA